jgi:hypothetical protein
MQSSRRRSTSVPALREWKAPQRKPQEKEPPPPQPQSPRVSPPPPPPPPQPKTTITPSPARESAEATAHKSEKDTLPPAAEKKAPREELLSAISKERVSRRDGQKEEAAPREKDNSCARPLETGTRPKLRPPSIATDDEDYAPAGLNQSQPLVPYPSREIADNRSELPVKSAAPRENRIPPEEEPKRPSETDKKGFLVYRGQFTVGGLEAVELAPHYLPYITAGPRVEKRAEPPPRPPPPSCPAPSGGRFRPVSPRTAALLEEPIDWADEPEVVVEEESQSQASEREIAEGLEAVGILNRCQSRFLQSLEDAAATLSYIHDLTRLPEWQGHFIGNWELRRDLNQAISLYRKTAYRCHVFDEAGLFDEGGDRIVWLLARCRELLHNLGLLLLAIDAEDINGWASYDPPRAMDPLIRGEIVWPPMCRNRRPLD